MKILGRTLSPLAHRLVSPALTLLVIALAGGLIFMGTSIISERAAAVEGPEPAALARVSATYIEPQSSLTITRQFQGQIEPVQTVNLSFQQGGEISALYVDEGDRVTAGQSLAELDTRLLEAEMARLIATRQSIGAQLELARLTEERQAILQEGAFVSDQQLDRARLSVAELEARVAEINAALTQVEVQLSQASLIAPFDGQVASRSADVGSVVGAGAPVLEVLEDAAPLFRVGLDPKVATPEALAQAKITLGDKTYDAQLQGFRPDLDRQTRTRTALFVLKTNAPAYLQAGTLHLTMSLKETGYALPLGALQDGVRGLWTVLLLRPTDEEGVYEVGHEAVELLHLEGDVAYVRGTLSGPLHLIDAGTHRVVPGEHVQLAPAQKGGAQ